MKKVFIVLVCMLSVVFAFADGAEDGKKFEISLQSGIAGGSYASDAVFGATVSYRLSKRFAIEGDFFYFLNPSNNEDFYYNPGGGSYGVPVFMGIRDSDSQAVFMNVSGIFSFNTGKTFVPYVAVGFGANAYDDSGFTIYGFENGGEFQVPFSNHSTSLNTSVGGGLKVHLTKNSGLRLDARLYYVFFDDTKPFRITAGYFIKL